MIRICDFSHCSLEPLRGYQGEDIEIVLPRNLTVYDIDWLGIWCVRFTQNFGHVYIPKDLDVPPALGQTKITVNRKDLLRERTRKKYDRGHVAEATDVRLKKPYERRNYHEYLPFKSYRRFF